MSSNEGQQNQNLDSPMHSLVSEDGVYVSRRLFYDDLVFEQEKKAIFSKSWLFLGHESQILNPGDYFLTRMADESVILSRGKDHRIHALLNTCRHRGLKVCRADQGNTKTFNCPYHGWSYGVDGSLRGVPGEKEAFPDGLDKAKLGLIPVAQVASYRSLIFGNFSKEADPLEGYLGEMKWYLDIHLNRSPNGTEVLGLQKWVIDTNWKMPAENQIGDVIHGPLSHASVFELGGGVDAPAVRSVVELGRNVSLPNGHGCLVAGLEEPERVLGLMDESAAEIIDSYFAETKDYRQQALGNLREHLDVATATVFPSFSMLGRNFTIRVAHPISGSKTEYWSWVLVDKDASSQVKDTFRKMYQSTFGPAGLLEADDGENWSEVTSGASGSQSVNYDFYYGMGMGCDGPHDQLPGSVGHTKSEHPQRGFYKHWKKLMRACSEEAG